MMRVGIRLLVVLLLAIPIAAAADAVVPPQPSHERLVVRVYFEDPQDIRALSGFDVWEHVDPRERYVLVAVAPELFPALEAIGLRLELDVERAAELNAPRDVSPTQVSGIPGYSCYRTVEETYATAEQIVAQHPDLAQWIDIGDSWDKVDSGAGWDMMVLVLTNSAIPGPKPKLFITTSIHAREYTPAELNTRFAEHLIDNYGVDADATWILDYHEIHLMLMANPDARKWAEQGFFWRKNTNQAYCSPTSSDRGADLNRNFEFQWGCCGGASGNECHELYRGPFGGSEPETQVVQSYLRAQFPDQRADPLDAPAPVDATGIYFDIHASGKLVLWPWGFGGTSPNVTAFQTFGRKLAYFNNYWPEQAVDLYPTDGTTIDFGYGDLGIAAIAYELGVSFFENCSTFENQTYPDNLPSLIYAAKVPRTPFLTPAGPDAVQVEANPPLVFQGEPIDLEATIDDARFNNQNGTEPTQTVAAAEYYIDLPPWAAGSPAPAGMLAVDGGFDSSAEPVTATLDTTDLDPGRHIVFVRGQDSDGNWGAFSATFIDITSDEADDDDDGVANGVDCDPADSTVWALPTPARDLTVTKNPLSNLSWQAPELPGGLLIDYEVLRSDSPSDFGAATCVTYFGALVATDGSIPPSGDVYHYLIRVDNRCGATMGADSSGQPRTGAVCPP